MKGVWAVPIIASILISGLFLASLPDASAAQDITPKKIKVKKDWSKIRVVADLSGFTQTQLSDLVVTLTITNAANGEVGCADQVNVETLEPEFTCNSPTVTINAIKLEKDFSKIRVAADLSGFTITQLSDLEVTFGLVNFDISESAFFAVNAETFEPAPVGCPPNCGPR